MDNEIIIKRENYLNQIKQAEQFFYHDIEDRFMLSDHKFSDTDGLVQFVIASQLNDKSRIIGKMDEIKKIQIALSSIATDYIIRYSDTRGRQYRTDVQFWGDIMGKLPLISVRNIENQTYQHVMKGFSIATNLLQLIMDIVVNANSPGMKSFSQFLQKQGDAIRLGLKKNNDRYSTITLASVIEAVGNENQVMYIPKLKLYKLDFDRTNSEVTSNCASNETINVEFNYSSCVSLFDYQALEDSEIKAAFERFLLKNKRKSIEKSDNFFSGEF
ncbi:hypothetical protein [Xenorhabdus innexi]|uniref:Virulence factor Evf domain-containing protein n=1 Tax=Xenorhabdus innexi TaxID=290109 RepID=A0A1N6MYA4_9GAMM|nr:hypothetical protein [Xenorhabdus innexi]PHM38795.1 hypothetical protein Xinn_00081 [Xenorhabdus innexi]SIP73764.1 conserved hypothetical protein [Xenorhabdus innexi]